jgi:hypothetical protein
MMAKLCAQTMRAFRNRNLMDPERASLTLFRGRGSASAETLEEISDKFEESWRDPSRHIDTTSIPDVDDYIQAVEDICGASGLKRICILFDEAAHVFRLDQQHAFFSLFRDLRSPSITCNAAVYPGITSYGPSFELAHDATLVRLERNVLDDNYVELMREMVIKQATKKIEQGTGEDKSRAERLIRQARPGGSFDRNFPVLAYSAHGNPRHLLKTVGTLDDFKPTDVEALVKEYYREDIWKEHTALGDKFPAYKSIVDWGRDFVEDQVVPELAERNRSPETRGTLETTSFFWISREARQEVVKGLSLLAYVGLVQELDRAVRGTRRQLGTRYSVHLGTLLSQAASPIREVSRIIPNLSKKRMIEFGRQHPALEGVAFKQVVSEDMMSMEVINNQLGKPVSVLDLSQWQIGVLQENGFSTVRRVLDAGEKKLREKIFRVGEVRSRQMVNAAKSAILEYLLG